jgi:recombinational DNA repair protein (RecF pathway)
VPGQQLQTSALVLTRQPSTSDSFEQLGAFSDSHGVLPCLRRIARTAAGAGTVLDLFDEAELWLESSNQGRTWFIRECRIERHHAGIGRSYEALKAAAALARLVLRNPVSPDSQVPVGALLRQSLQALDEGARPDLVWLKALYRFLRDEGLPVKEHWWQHLAAEDRAAAAELLQHPIAGQEIAPAAVARLILLLEDWVQGETDLKLR